MAEVVQIERPAPRLRICPVCKQPTHLGCDHAVVEFQAEQREKRRQANRASYEKKSNENKERRNPTTVENTKESDNGSGAPVFIKVEPKPSVEPFVFAKAEPSGGPITESSPEDMKMPMRVRR